MSCEGCPNQGSCSKDASSCSVETNAQSKIKHVIAVLSGKGGVGKSTITVMLARAMQKQGLRVGIMDADITGPSIPRLMNAHERYAYATKENEIIPVDVDGIKIMSLNYLVQNESDPVIWRGPILGNVVKHRCRLGRAGRAAHRHAAGHRRRGADDFAVAAGSRRAHGVHTAANGVDDRDQSHQNVSGNARSCFGNRGKHGVFRMSELPGKSVVLRRKRTGAISS